MKRRHYALYRAFDEEGTLLYVGCTCNPASRIGAHTRKDWWLAAVRFEIEHLGLLERNAAHELEAEAILREQPVHNIAAKRGPMHGPFGPPPPPGVDVVTAKAAAQHFGLNPWSLRTKVASHRLAPFYRDAATGKLLVTLDDIQQLMERTAPDSHLFDPRTTEVRWAANRQTAPQTK